MMPPAELAEPNSASFGGESAQNLGQKRKKHRIAYLVSHPIQYQAPLLRVLSAEPDIDLTVFFQSDFSVRNFQDPGFGRAIQWDVPLLEGYRHEFLPAFGRRNIPNPWSYGVASRLWRGNFDFFWVHGYARWFNWAAILAARVAKIPVFVRDEPTSISALRSPTKAKLKRIFFFGALRALCDTFLAIGTLNRRYYLENGIAPNRIRLMPYCVDNEYFANLAKRAAPRRETFRAQLGLKSGRPVILYASKFERRKRASDLLIAFKKLVAQSPTGETPYLLFVGDGDTRAELETNAHSIAEHVRFLGFRNQPELPAFFDLCDVFVLPSEFETWGLIVNEVMSVGRAIIVSDHVGCGPDLVKNGVNGFVYPLGNVDALAENLQYVLRSQDTIAAMGHASAEIIGDWNFQRDIEGLRSAITATVARRKKRTA